MCLCTGLWNLFLLRRVRLFRDHAEIQGPQSHPVLRSGNRTICHGRGRHHAKHGHPSKSRSEAPVDIWNLGNACLRPHYWHLVCHTNADLRHHLGTRCIGVVPVLRLRDILRTHPLRILQRDRLGETSFKDNRSFKKLVLYHRHSQLGRWSLPAEPDSSKSQGQICLDQCRLLHHHSHLVVLPLSRDAG